MTKKKSAAKQNKNIPDKIRMITVTCITCENGKRFNPSKCTLCKGSGHIKVMEEK